MRRWTGNTWFVVIASVATVVLLSAAVYLTSYPPKPATPPAVVVFP